MGCGAARRRYAISSSLLERGSKLLLARPRPHPTHPVAHAAGFSFPSGHSTAIATLATLATLAAIIVVALALAVAASRVLLGVHYLSDLVAGLALGVAVSSAAVLVAESRFVGACRDGHRRRFSSGTR